MTTAIARRAGAFVAEDAAFRRVTGTLPVLEKLVDLDAHEGPTYRAGEDALYVTTVPRGLGTWAPRACIKRIDLSGIALSGAVSGGRVRLTPAAVSVVPADVVMPNGMTLAPDGSLLVCEQGDRAHPAAIIRVDPATGARTTVVASFRRHPLSSPNDVVVRSDGTLWFTDPAYGHLQGFRPAPVWKDAVYRYDPRSGELAVVADHFDKPNGLVFAPDESVLYVGDSGADQGSGSFHAERPHHVYAYDVVGGRSLSHERVLDVTTPGAPDGLAVDAEGRVYVACATGVRVLSPEGRLLGHIRLPGAVNLTFGGPDGNHLYLTADTAVWLAVLDTKGA